MLLKYYTGLLTKDLVAESLALEEGDIIPRTWLLLGIR
jgi:hypothetical protein